MLEPSPEVKALIELRLKKRIVLRWRGLAEMSIQPYKLPLNLILADIRQESSGDPREYSFKHPETKAMQPHSAVGLMMVRQGALTDFNRAHGSKWTLPDLLNPELNLQIGPWYLWLMVNKCLGDFTNGLRAYNQGYTRWKRDERQGKWYSDSVLRHAVEFAELLKTTKLPAPPA